MSESKLAADWNVASAILNTSAHASLTMTRGRWNIITLATVCFVIPFTASVNMNMPFLSVLYGYFCSCLSFLPVLILCFFSFTPPSLPSFLLFIFYFLFYLVPPTFCHLLLQTFDKCFLGSSETADANRVFCGQIGAVYLFGEALSAAQILAIYQLGPGYQVGRQKTCLIRCLCDI